MPGKPHEADVVLPESEARRMAATVPAWTYLGTRLEREVSFASFSEAMAFVNRVATVAEQMDHHPDMHIAYRQVRFVLSTHKAGGLTAADFRLAAEIDRLLGQPGDAS